jgi:hypothetical protein
MDYWKKYNEEMLKAKNMRMNKKWLVNIF